jgi:hypothetical protein
MHGIHRVMLFRILAEQWLEAEEPILQHIHNVYATWRHKNGLPGNYLLR